jgi:hypothetical protein
MELAPRGLLYHRYELGADGLVRGAADIVPPTAQNQDAIEEDLRQLVQRHLDLDDQRLTALCEQAIRNYDPCGRAGPGAGPTAGTTGRVRRGSRRRQPRCRPDTAGERRGARGGRGRGRGVGDRGL